MATFFARELVKEKANITGRSSAKYIDLEVSIFITMAIV
jgi:hypothetical protein